MGCGGSTPVAENSNAPAPKPAANKPAASKGSKNPQAPTEKPKPVAFEVDLGDERTSSGRKQLPAHLQERLQRTSDEASTKAELEAKLKKAEERREQQEEERVQKLKAENEKVEKIMEEQKALTPS